MMIWETLIIPKLSLVTKTSSLNFSEKILFEAICDLLPKHKARIEAPPKELIEEKRAQFIAMQKKERLDRQREYNKKGIRTTKKKTKPA